MRKNTGTTNIYNLTRIALCVSLLCVSSYLVIPLPFTPVVISLHTIMVNLVGLIFKPRQAGMTVLVYLLMGAVGLPVFSAGTSGVGKLLGPTGGFYVGFLFAAVAVSFLKGQRSDFRRYVVVTAGVGLPIQHIFAVGMMMFHNGGNLAAAFLTVSLPFIITDVIKCVMASLIGCALRKMGRFT